MRTIQEALEEQEGYVYIENEACNYCGEEYLEFAPQDAGHHYHMVCVSVCKPCLGKGESIFG